MLVLSRKNGESIQIGQSIEVKVLEVGGGRVKLGFSAPRDVEIQRSELDVADHAFSATNRMSKLSWRL
jgi:carbon storage regulator